jgi:tRNA pseudouridine32 synthase / 23S rRNA pseudouridine746 synthase
MSSSFDVVHVDDTLLIVVKAANLLAVPGRGEGVLNNLATRVQAQFSDALVVHRLDMATSGLMLFARGAGMQRALSQLFAQRAVTKHYTAVVHGLVQETQGRIELPLAADWPNRPRQIVDALHGKASLTHWQRLALDLDSAATRLQLQPITGRSHQLRVHLQAIGHPIVGDTLYAPPDAGATRLLLHACHLSFPHPADGRTCSFDNPAPF